MLSHYFGSKEGLFSEALKQTSGVPFMLTQESVSAFLTEDSRPQDLAGFFITLRSASNQQALAMARETIETRYEAELAAQLTGPNSRGRAALLIAITTGLLLMRDAVGLESLQSGEAEELVPYLEAIVRILYDAEANPDTV